MFSLALLLLVQTASYQAIRASLTHHAESGVPGRLQVGERVLERLRDQRAHKLLEGARILAADFGFRSALLTHDAATIASVLENQDTRIGATKAVLFGVDLSVRASSGLDAGELRQIAARLAVQPATGGTSNEVTLLHGWPFLLVVVPMKAPMLVGWVLMGFAVDEELATDMKRLSALDVTLLTRPEGSARWSLAFTTLPTAQARGLAALDWSAHPGTADIREARIAGETLAASVHWLTPAGRPGDETRAGGDALALVSLSVDEAVRLPSDLQLSLLCITLFGFLVFLIGSLVTVRRVTTPLRALASAADRLRAGDYATPIDGERRSDEIGQLAHAFEQMRVSVAEKQQQILRLAYWDSLTELPNRVQLRDEVRDAIAAAQRVPGGGHVAVLMLDLDRFKHVNDVLGYRFGDLLLQRVAERLTLQMVRGADLVARLGGDEFAVLLRHGDAGLAQAVAQRISASFSEPMTLEGHTVDMGAGVGIACFPEHGTDADLLLSHAEVAMYAAKHNLRGPLMYDPSIDAASAQTLSLLSELRQAIERDELRLYLQPKLALASGHVAGAETLVRWLHPTRGLLPPMDFIPFAEQTGFIRTLTMWVFEEAARHWLLLQGTGLSTVLSVNLSTRDLMDQDLPQKFATLLAKHRVPAEAFCLEITESAIMDDPQRALGTLDRLSALGYRLSIDDFGTGYSSLAYLKRLPVDELKIDKSFVLNMEKDPDDAQIVRSTIDLAHNLGLSVVAEGVETSKAWELLRELDCDEAQGYHMGKPMPATEFNDWSLAWALRMRPHAADVAPLTLH